MDELEELGDMGKKTAVGKINVGFYVKAINRRDIFSMFWSTIVLGFRK
jgi:hypothetical protein